MKRFLSTTAVVLAMSGAAYAEMDNKGFGDIKVEQSDFFASDLIGMRIYNSETEFDADARVADGAEQEWDDIGEINDIILSQNGDVRAVILGVGGFLGMGERDVSVSMDSIKVLREEGDSDDRFLVVNTSKEMLEKAPAFERDMSEEVNAELQEAEAETEQMAENAETATEERMPLTRPAVEREGYQEAEMEAVQAMTADDLTGSYVYGANDETVGEVDSLIMGENGQVSEVVINVGGFLGLGEKPVAVTFEELQILKNVEGDDFRIYIDSTEEKLEQLPEHNG
ncbi:PRC-barrel domain-containing protein [Sulfitobacter aestuariivivens]|uniref:PRC-barrel domain-containing protein n=1 Tax=Sulfitobacter aestuariivivens TaxID=2766981 RepID=A0A927D4B1_9RHOB|nr:PRC-barrel domain-containing protein [Sulfitobacter aestuariivivens]MBD3664003.1 PRC-barrel domain-containing protein [Sulfitobacter aestuariivivens]